MLQKLRSFSNRLAATDFLSIILLIRSSLYALNVKTFTRKREEKHILVSKRLQEGHIYSFVFHLELDSLQLSFVPIPQPFSSTFITNTLIYILKNANVRVQFMSRVAKG